MASTNNQPARRQASGHKPFNSLPPEYLVPGVQPLSREWFRVVSQQDRFWDDFARYIPETTLRQRLTRVISSTVIVNTMVTQAAARLSAGTNIGVPNRVNAITDNRDGDDDASYVEDEDVNVEKQIDPDAKEGDADGDYKAMLRRRASGTSEHGFKAFFPPWDLSDLPQVAASGEDMKSPTKAANVRAQKIECFHCNVKFTKDKISRDEGGKPWCRDCQNKSQELQQEQLHPPIVTSNIVHPENSVLQCPNHIAKSINIAESSEQPTATPPIPPKLPQILFHRDQPRQPDGKFASGCKRPLDQTTGANYETQLEHNHQKSDAAYVVCEGQSYRFIKNQDGTFRMELVGTASQAPASLNKRVRTETPTATAKNPR